MKSLFVLIVGNRGIKRKILNHIKKNIYRYSFLFLILTYCIILKAFDFKEIEIALSNDKLLNGIYKLFFSLIAIIFPIIYLAILFKTISKYKIPFVQFLYISYKKEINILFLIIFLNIISFVVYNLLNLKVNYLFFLSIAVISLIYIVCVLIVLIVEFYQMSEEKKAINKVAVLLIKNKKIQEYIDEYRGNEYYGELLKGLDSSNAKALLEIYDYKINDLTLAVMVKLYEEENFELYHKINISDVIDRLTNSKNKFNLIEFIISSNKELKIYELKSISHEMIYSLSIYEFTIIFEKMLNLGFVLKNKNLIALIFSNLVSFEEKEKLFLEIYKIIHNRQIINYDSSNAVLDAPLEGVKMERANGNYLFVVNEIRVEDLNFNSIFDLKKKYINNVDLFQREQDIKSFFKLPNVLIDQMEYDELEKVVIHYDGELERKIKVRNFNMFEFQVLCQLGGNKNYNY